MRVHHTRRTPYVDSARVTREEYLYIVVVNAYSKYTTLESFILHLFMRCILSSSQHSNAAAL